MRDFLIIFLAVSAILLILYFMTAKGPSRKIAIINPDGSRVEVSVEIADNITTRAKGLMGRQSLGESDGMLFIFDKSDIQRFWMLNTSLPLDAIFIALNGTVVDVIQMDPCGWNVTRCKLYTPRAEARYVIEVNQGFSQKHGIIIGKSSMGLSTIR